MKVKRPTNKILLAGATGYLGTYVLKELINRDVPARIVVRNTKKTDSKVSNSNLVEILKAQVTNPGSIIDCCEDIDTVISTVGITKQKDGLSYLEVDYQANLNLLKEAQKSGVRKFIYVSVLNGEQLRHLKICQAKERFVDELRNSGLAYCIIRPNGFFSDMGEFLNMDKKGSVYLFGQGEFRSNPIHGQDLAKVCVDMIYEKEKQVNVGGPETLTQKEIAEIVFKVLGKKKKVVYIPDWVRRLILGLAKFFTGSKTYGPMEFFMTVMSMDMIAPEYGKHSLEAYYAELVKGNKV